MQARTTALSLFLAVAVLLANGRLRIAPESV